MGNMLVTESDLTTSCQAEAKPLVIVTDMTTLVIPLVIVAHCDLNDHTGHTLRTPTKSSQPQFNPQPQLDRKFLG